MHDFALVGVVLVSRILRNILDYLLYEFAAPGQRARHGAQLVGDSIAFDRSNAWHIFLISMPRSIPALALGADSWRRNH